MHVLQMKTVHRRVTLMRAFRFAEANLIKVTTDHRPGQAIFLFATPRVRVYRGSLTEMVENFINSKHSEEAVAMTG